MRIESLGSLQLKQELQDFIKNLEVGDIVKGRVMETGNGTVTIKTLSGQMLTAALMTDINLQKGLLVELLVNNIAGDKILTELHGMEKKNEAPDEVLKQMLSQMDVPVNEKTMEAAKTLIKYNMPVDPKNLAEVINFEKTAASLSNTSSEGTVGLLVSEKNLNNTSVDVLNKIALTAEQSVKNKIAEFENQAANPKNTSQTGNGISTGQSADLQDGPEAIPITAKTTTIMKEEPHEQTNSKLQVPENIKAPMQADNEPVIIGQQANEKTDTRRNNHQANNMQDTAVVGKTPQEMEAEITRTLNKLGIEADEQMNSMISKAVKVLETVKGSNLENIAFLLSKEMEVTPKNIEQLTKSLSHENKLSGFLDKLQMQIDLHEHTGLREIKETIRNLFLHPKQIENKEEIKENLKEIVRLGEKIEAFMISSKLDDNDIRNTLMNLKDNIEFLKNINEYNNYLQIPVLINQNQTTAEIYVYKDGSRNKKIDPNNATILIALDLKNLGHIESMVNINQKSVNVTFRTQDEKVSVLINQKLDDLKQAIEARGYTLNPVRLIKMNEAFNLMTLEQVINESHIDKLHFDMKV